MTTKQDSFRASTGMSWSNVYNADGVCVAHCQPSAIKTASGTKRVTEEQCKVNAALFAAAPDLLAACEAALASLDTLGEGEYQTAAVLRAAISKARGE